MLQSVSACDIVKERPGFGQTVRPVAGSIVASPVLGFLRPRSRTIFSTGSATRRSSSMRVRMLYEAGDLGAQALDALRRFRALQLVAAGARRARARRDRRSGAQRDAGLRAIPARDDLADRRGRRGLRGHPRESRRHARHLALDAAAARRPAAAGARVLRWLRTLRVHVRGARQRGGACRRRASAAHRPRVHCRSLAQSRRFDIWEEEHGPPLLHVARFGGGAARGADVARAPGKRRTAARALRAEARAIRERLDRFWLRRAGYYRSRIMPPGVTSTKLLDIAVILSAVHAGDGERRALRARPSDARHARCSSSGCSTGSTRSITARPRERAPAMGRYEGDVYYSGGAYYFSTLGAAEFCFLAARRMHPAARSAQRGSRAATASSRPFAPSRRRAAIFPSSSISARASKRRRSISRGAMPRSSRASTARRGGGARHDGTSDTTRRTGGARGSAARGRRRPRPG